MSIYENSIRRLLKELLPQEEIISVMVQSINADGTVNIIHNGLIIPRVQTTRPPKLGQGKAVVSKNSYILI